MVDVDQFEAEYCPPIDTALYSAIISDFDLSTENGVSAARATLDPLKESAEVEEAAGFDAAGVGSHDLPESVERSSRQDQSVFDSESVSRYTDDSSLSHRFSPLNLNGDETSNENDNDMDVFDEETKILLLHELFGEQITSETIKTALHKSDGRWHSAMEDLLNQVYFIDADEIEPTAVKGIDGFAIGEGGNEKAKKRKRNRQNKRDLQQSSTKDELIVRPPSKWEQGQKDVDYLSTALHLSQASVRSTYNANGRSMPRTIEALLDQYSQQHANRKLTTEINVLVHDLTTTYSLTPAMCTAIAQATQLSFVTAHEIASALITPSKTSDVAIIPQYAAPIDETIEGSTWQTVSKKKITNPLLISDDFGQSQLDAARQTRAFEQARAAHRKARSDHLMGGAAGYYSQLGREYGARIHSANAASADRLADMQSSSTQVDLHGVDVLNGVRIAQERVEAWWRSTAEQRVSGRAGAAQRSSEYCIVVGSGTHSEGGKSKLGPSVSKMLRSEGWRFIQEGAVIVVKGKQK